MGFAGSDMPQMLQINCVNKSNRLSAHERITHVGGYKPKVWRLTQEEAIWLIKANSVTFYTEVNGVQARGVVATTIHGREYIKTENDGDQPNNLLSLPECP